MGGFDDHISIMGEWMAPHQSPNGDFSSTISNNIKISSVAESVSDNQSGHLFLGNPDNTDQVRDVMVGDEASNSNAIRQMSSRGGLVERMAARAGINVPRLDTDSIRPADLSTIPEVQSPYLTIPPGLSPTTLLDSPVFLSNSLVLPSPTTGKFSLVSAGNNLNSTLTAEDHGMGKRNTCVDANSSSFAFQTVAESGLSRCFNTVDKVNPSSSVPPFASVGVYRAEPPQAPSQNNGTFFQQTNYPMSYAEDNGLSNLSSELTYNSASAAKHSSPLEESHEDDGDQLSNGDPNAGGSPSEDGYNWRKYGQKQVKGSEYPRSYFKCTHPNCPVKKKVERSEEGDITEIIYKGAHNHSKPPFNRRLALGSSNPLGDVQLGPEQHGTGADDALMWSTLQKGSLEVTQSVGLGQEYGIGANSLLSQTGQLELGDGVEGSSTFSNEDDDDDHVTHGSLSIGYDGEGDESESKRRRIETYASDISGATRAIREPRVVVQTTSEVDILDDGYRWRKYGQKVVKGNPNPRSYYKCTSPGCNVRKHVERASHDLKSVITTYEGKHNHDVPAARNSSHVNSGSNPTQQAATSSSLVRRPQPSQVHVGSSPFRTPPLGIGSFGRPRLGPGPGPGPGFGFGVNQPGFASLALAGLGPNQGRFPVLPVHSYVGNQAGPMGNNMGFMVPKGEPKMEPVTDSGLNQSNASTVYQQLMSRLPLGPHM